MGQREGILIASGPALPIRRFSAYNMCRKKLVTSQTGPGAARAGANWVAGQSHLIPA
jgi:hypothetical protein